MVDATSEIKQGDPRTRTDRAIGLLSRVPFRVSHPNMLRAPLAVALIIAAAAPAAAQNFDTVQVRTTPLGKGVYMLTGAGGNMGLSVGDDAVFLIDDEYAPLTPKIRAAIAALTPKPVRFVLNTHWHGDHTGGNKDHGEAGALIVAHDNVRKRLSTPQFMAAFNQSTPAQPKAALPVVTFNDTVTFWLNGDTVTAFHVAPAHTDGDAIVYFHGANVVHMGDVFVSAGFPLIDLSSGGSVHGFIKASERVLPVIDAKTKVIPGHGPLADKARLQAFHDMLVALRDRIQKEIAAGHSIDQILASNITADYDASWPSGRERFLRFAYQEMSKK
jgi:glyoxylase-like metal-dependent hydrolase (beta-lactamase superfamily II)